MQDRQPVKWLGIRNNNLWVTCRECEGRGYTTNGVYETTCTVCSGRGGFEIVQQLALFLLLFPHSEGPFDAVIDVLVGMLPLLYLLVITLVLAVIWYLIRGDKNDGSSNHR
jgi:hypothetical protein